MESVNKVVSLHKSEDPKQILLLDNHYEVFNPILSCSNQEKMTSLCSTQLNVHFQKFKVWDSTLPLYVIPQVFSFLDIIDWCASHYSVQNQPVITQVNIFITINAEGILKMMGLDMTNFFENNTFPLTEETLVHKFTNLSPQEHVSFIDTL